MNLSRRSFLGARRRAPPGTALAGGVLIGGAQADADAAATGGATTAGLLPVPRRRTRPAS